MGGRGAASDLARLAKYGKEFQISISLDYFFDKEDFSTTEYYSVMHVSGGEEIFNGRSKSSLTVSWSKEINEHAVDHDWTK